MHNRVKISKCAHCGKDISWRQYSYDGYAYKLSHKGSLKVFCSWSCLRAFENKHRKPDKHKLKVEIVGQMYSEGYTAEEIAARVNRSVSTIQDDIYEWMNTRRV